MADIPLSIVVAMASNRVIGDGGGMPWHLPVDLRHAKDLTMGKPLIMGRRTHESIGRVLPGRANIVLSRDPAFQVPGGHVVANLALAIDLAREIATEDGAEEVIIFGGAQIYALALDQVTRIYLTEVDVAASGDAYFPELDAYDWREIARAPHPVDGDQPGYAFVTLERHR
jgi:dihydrofolate reductase